ncbi:MAG: synthase subunit delta [Frankiales bacterium]|nr:synthase subunit delta [Frankiales bacterium]
MQGASRQALVAVRERLTAVRTELADSGGSAGLGSIAEGLFAVVRLLDREGHLRRTFGDPSLDRRAKEQLADELLGGQLDPLALGLLKEAVTQRWSSSRDLVDALEVLAVTAVFLAAEADGSLDQVEDELFRFARTVAREPELRAVLTDRALPDDRKQALVDGLLEGKVRPATKRIVQALVLTPRGRTLEDGLEDYSALAADVRSRALATVTTAVPLDDAQRERLAASLSAQLGRPVQLQIEIDPQVIGGVVVHVGDEVIDGSTRHRLATARRRLA